MAIYNPKDVVGVVSGFVLDGFAPDTFIEASYSEDTTTMTIGNSGSSTGTFNINPNTSGTIKFTLMHNSPSLTELTALSYNTAVPLPIAVYDSQDKMKSVVAGAKCMIKKKPDFARAKELGTIEFEFNVIGLEIANVNA